MKTRKISIPAQSKELKKDKGFQRFTSKNVLILALLTILYLGVVLGLMELRDDHVMLLVVIWVLYFLHPVTRKIFYGFIWILFYWLIYDSLRVYPNYLVNPVHISEPYNLELAWFGIMEGGKLLTPNQYFANHETLFMDVMCGAFYLSWVPVPFAFAFYLYFKDKGLMLQFTFSFFLVNMIAIVIYYLYPAAPPWYVKMYGLDVQKFNIPGQAAGLLKFDQFVGLDIFKGMYEKNGNVFAAIPSMHSAFPVLTTYFALKKKWYFSTCFFFFTIIGIWLAAVYTYHHYFVDVLAGGLTAVVTILIVEGLLKTRARQWYYNYKKLLL